MKRVPKSGADLEAAAAREAAADDLWCHQQFSLHFNWLFWSKLSFRAYPAACILPSRRCGACYSSVEMENAEALLASPRRSPNRKCMSDVPALHNFALSQPINQDPRSFLGRGVHFFAFTASVLAADQSVRD
jgi:hypothetical protein